MLRWNKDIMVFCRLVYQKFSCLMLRTLKIKVRQLFREMTKLKSNSSKLYSFLPVRDRTAPKLDEPQAWKRQMLFNFETLMSLMRFFATALFCTRFLLALGCSNLSWLLKS